MSAFTIAASEGETDFQQFSQSVQIELGNINIPVLHRATPPFYRRVSQDWKKELGLEKLELTFETEVSVKLEFSFPKNRAFNRKGVSVSFIRTHAENKE
jgi:hypothetical protein